VAKSPGYNISVPPIHLHETLRFTISQRTLKPVRS
jgi:hypothetical protein